VQQRGGVDELDDRRGLDVAVAAVAAGPGGEQHRQRPQPLAARADDVVGDLVDQCDVARQALDDDPVEASQFVRHRFPDVLELHSGHDHPGSTLHGTRSQSREEWPGCA